jgi:hypothetical protein
VRKAITAAVIAILNVNIRSRPLARAAARQPKLMLHDRNHRIAAEMADYTFSPW